jgi:hypothetical protein
MALPQKNEIEYFDELDVPNGRLECKTLPPGFGSMLRRLKKKYFTKKTSDLLLQVFLFFNFQSNTVCPGSGLTKEPDPEPDS